jgi:O-antigen ligase
VINAVCIAGAGVAVLGLCQEFFKVRWVPQPVPPSAVFGNANMAADYLSIVVPIVLALAIQRRRSVLGFAAGAVIILSALFIYYTHARAAYLAVVCAAGWMGLLLLKRRPEMVRVVKSAMLIVAAAALIVMAAVLASGDLNKVMSRAGTSALYRATVWRNSFQMFKDRPVLGFGAGSFRISYGAYSYRAISDRAFTKARQIRKAHNEYVQSAVELGVPGLVLFIVPLFYGLLTAWRLVPYGKKSHHDMLISGLSGGLISFVITAFFSFPWQRSMPPLMLVVCLGFLAVCRMQQGQTTGALVRCKAPKALMACLLVIALVMGVWLTRYNVRNILSDRYFQTALMMEKKRKGEEALKAASKAHAYNPDRLDVMTTLGRAYLATNNLEEGIKTLEEVCNKWPYNLNALIILGVGYTNIGRNDKALETLRQVLKIQPSTNEAKNIIATIKSQGKAFVNLQ